MYVRIWKNRISVRDVRTGEQFNDEPLIAFENGPRKKVVAVGREARREATSRADLNIGNGFDHPRSILGDFVLAEKALRHAFGQLYKERYFQPSPVVVMHPIEKLDGGLTDIERRALLELAEGAGARKAYVWTGRELTDGELRENSIWSRLAGVEA